MPDAAPPHADTPFERRAVIDIGTNSVKLLVADVAPGRVIPLLEQSQQTRLGRGMFAERQLQAEAIVDTAGAAADFAAIAGQAGAARTNIIATSAAREALNHQALAAAVEHACGLPMQIISGEQEALWAFRGVVTDPRFAGKLLLILDVGGGSTEVIVGRDHDIQFTESLPLGTVRLLEARPVSDPPARQELAACRAFLTDFIEKHLARAIARLLPAPHEAMFVGTGGTSSILARIGRQLHAFDRAAIEAATLSRQEVTDLVELLWKLPLAERRRVPGLPPKRADVALFGAVTYEAVMQALHLPQLSISTRGLRFAAVCATP